MRKIVLFLVCVLGLYLIHQGYINWHNRIELKKTNLKLQRNINEMKEVSMNLQSLKDKPLGLLQEAYKTINKKIILFSRDHDLKTTIDFSKSNKKGFIAEVEEKSLWIGVKKIVLDIKFYGIRDLDEYMLVIGFLDTLESSNHLKVMGIEQRQDCLFTKVHIYGRDL